MPWQESIEVLHLGILILKFKLTKKVPVIFDSLNVYDSHLIMKEISKFDLKVSATLNGLEKYMDFKINKNLVFVGSMEFMNSSLDASIKNLSDNKFKYLSKEFSGEQLKLVKQKNMNIWTVLNSFLKVNYMIRGNFIVFWKMNVSVDKITCMLFQI